VSPPDVDDVSPEIQKRFAESRRELETSTQSTVTGAKEAGRVLALAGDLWRRKELLGDTTRDVVLAVDKVEAQAAQAFVASVDAEGEHKKLQRALDDAFEAILEEGEERALYTHSAEMALAARDALASAQAALAFALENGATAESTRVATLRTVKSELDDKLAKIDRGLVKKARCLVGINQARRRETAALDQAERATSWWWSSRANCDFLVSLYRSEDGAPGAQTRLSVTWKRPRSRTRRSTWPLRRCGVGSTATPRTPRSHSWIRTRRAARTASARSTRSRSPKNSWPRNSCLRGTRSRASR
jgi:hypothetical protein